MAVLRLHFRKTGKEWLIIQRIIQEKCEGKRRASRGDGVAQFIANEISKKYSGEVPEDDVAITTKKQKFFRLNVSDSVLKNIIKDANNVGLTPSQLICRVVLDPHILSLKSKNITEQK